MPRHEVGVLALPAVAGRLRRGLFHQRRGVDEDLQVVAVGVPDEAAERLQLALHHLVVVAALGIDRDRRALALLSTSSGSAGRRVVERQRHDRPGLVPQALRIGALLGALAQPAHVALPALRRRIADSRSSRSRARLGRQAGRRKAHGVEAQPQRLVADGVAQLGRRLPAAAGAWERAACGLIAQPSAIAAARPGRAATGPWAAAPVCQNTSIGMPPRGYQ